MFKEEWRIPEHFFRDYRDEINEKNRIQLQKISVIGGIMMVLLFVLSLVIPVLRSTMFCYVFGMSLAVVSLFLQKRLKNILVLFYVFLTGCFAFAVGLCMFAYPAHSTAAFCVFLVAIPTFLVDRPSRVFTFLFTVTAMYVLCVFYRISPESAPPYLVDGLSFFTFGFMVYRYNLHFQIKSLESHEEMKRKVEVDALTDLFTRGALEHSIETYIQTNIDDAAFILLDIDNFKGINDNFGHKAGDEVLHQTGGILKKQFRKSDYIGRLGGDEFVVFLPKIHNQSWLISRLEMLVEDMNRTFIGDEAVCKVTASIGVAMYPKDGTTFDELYRNADHAMYESKKSGKNQYTIHENNELDSES